MRFLALFDEGRGKNAAGRVELLAAACAARDLEFVPVDVSKPSYAWERPAHGDIVFATTRGAYFAEPLLITPDVISIYQRGVPYSGYDSDTTVISATLEAAGIPQPKTVYCDGDVSAEGLLAEFDLPFVIKLAGTTGGQGTVLVETERQLRSILSTLSGINSRFLVREFVPHDEVWRVLIVGGKAVDTLSKPVANSDFRSGTDQLLMKRLAAPQAVIHEAEAAASALGLAFGGVDVVMQHDGRAYVLEYNIRCDISGHVAEVTQQIVDYLLAKARVESRT